MGLKGCTWGEPAFGEGRGRNIVVSALWLSMGSAGCLMCPNWA